MAAGNIDRSDRSRVAERHVSVVPSEAPLVSGLVVHWHDEGGLEDLVAAWPRDPRFELVVVDNGSRRELQLPEGIVRVLGPLNYGFGGGVNLGASVARSDNLLILNSDIEIHQEALLSLMEGLKRFPQAAGLAPDLRGVGGDSQGSWQLKPLPTAWHLLGHAFFVDPLKGEGAYVEGQSVAQPAAACLLLRREVLESLGGMDPRFQPAWFEDVDLARRLQTAGEEILYWPRARVTHRGGATVKPLGYGRFLWIYWRNLRRYLLRHHGGLWAATFSLAAFIGALLRLVALPLRSPTRADGRWSAAGALLRVMLGLLTGFRRPKAWRSGGL